MSMPTPRCRRGPAGPARRARAGIALAYTLAILTVLIAVASLAVDYGRVVAAKGKLQDAADAAARYAARGLADGATLANANVAGAENPVEGAAVVFAAGDVQTGTWDFAARTFSAGADASTANAVRVTAYRTAERGNAVPLMLARILGIATCDVTATAVAALDPGIPSAFIGLEGIEVKNNLLAADYDSTYTLGPSKTNYHGRGSVASNGAITAKNNELVGSVVLGPAATHNLDGPTETFLDGPIPSPALDFSAAPAVNPGGAGKNLVVNGNVTLPAGTYAFDSILIRNNGSLRFAGPATLLISGDVLFDQNGEIRAYGNLPANLQIRQRGPGTQFGGENANSVEVTAEIEAPAVDFDAKNSGVLRGRATFRSINAKNNAEFYYDTTLTAVIAGTDDRRPKLVR